MTPPAMQKAVRGQAKALAVDALLRASPAARRELMDTVDQAFRDHPRTVHPVVCWRGYRLRGTSTIFRLVAEMQVGNEWVSICARWHD